MKNSCVAALPTRILIQLIRGLSLDESIGLRPQTRTTITWWCDLYRLEQFRTSARAFRQFNLFRIQATMAHASADSA